MTPEEFTQELTQQNKNQHLNGCPAYRAQVLTQRLLEDHPLSIQQTETLHSLCHDETLGVVMFGPNRVALYLQLRELHFCLIKYSEIKSIHMGRTVIGRRLYLQINTYDGGRKRIPALYSPDLLESVYKELKQRIQSE